VLLVGSTYHDFELGDANLLRSVTAPDVALNGPGRSPSQVSTRSPGSYSAFWKSTGQM